MDFAPIYLIFIPVVASIFVYLTNDNYSNAVAFMGQAAISIIAVRYFQLQKGFEHLHSIVLGGWSPVIGIVLRNDRISIVFVFLTILIWWSVMLYSWKSRGKDSQFMFFLMFLEGIYLGMLQTNDMFSIFVFIELITIVSAVLILYKKDGESVRAGLYYLIFNSMGILFYLVGMAMLYNAFGTLNINLLTGRIAEIKNIEFISTAYIFIMAAVGVKSAFFPVFNWLPKAHSAAPSSISALLSGLLVKSGLYVFIRMNVMFNYDGLDNFFLFIGFITAFAGVVFALSQKDIKRILAFHTISQVGIIMMGLNALDPSKRIGGIMHMVNHAFFKSLLFMGAGAIIHVYKKRNVSEIRGVLKKMPFVSIFMIVGMFSITGMPFFNGFVSKTIIKEGLKEFALAGMGLRIVNIGTMVSFIKLSQIFFGEGDSKMTSTDDLPEKVGMIVPAVSCIALGIFHVPLMNLLLDIDIGYINPMSVGKWMDYFINAAIGFLVYTKIIARDFKFVRRIRQFKISFSNSNYLLVLYIVLMMVFRG
ncbi:MAG TPA: proton-conducting transporter membrane subunit [Clostridia bacterium]|nr:proton-conducting transporter membrane subunit [Clostridia bacterium]